ncbi:hypothetical protein MTO96_002999 [Rhipicephalus appendiculatus]
MAGRFPKGRANRTSVLPNCGRPNPARLQGAIHQRRKTPGSKHRHGAGRPIGSSVRSRLVEAYDGRRCPAPRVRAHVPLGRLFREREEKPSRRPADANKTCVVPQARRLERPCSIVVDLLGRRPDFSRSSARGYTQNFDEHPFRTPLFPSFFPRRSREGDSPVFVWEDAVVASSDGDTSACRPLASLAVLPYFTATTADASSTLIPTRKPAAPEEHRRSVTTRDNYTYPHLSYPFFAVSCWSQLP